MLRFWRMPPELAEKILGASAGGPVSVEELALLCGTTKNQMIEQIARLAKLNLVTLQAPD
jgi:hypothetical protein